MLGIRRAIVARLPAIRPLAAGCRRAVVAHWNNGAECLLAFFFPPCCEFRCFTVYKVVKIAMWSGFNVDLLFLSG